MTAMTPGFADPARDAALAFRAILNAMARPGTVATLSVAAPAGLSPAAAAVLLTLVDRTTPVYLAPGHDTAPIRDWLAFHCGAAVVDAPEAAFAVGTWQALHPLNRFAIGTAEYPDRSATLIVDGYDGQPVTLTGPGIDGQTDARLPDPDAFAENHARFPLGWDAMLCDGDRMIAIPRSTEVR